MSKSSAAFVTLACLAVSACGGGSAESTPTPTPTPSAPVAKFLLPQKTSQEFDVYGERQLAGTPTISIAAADQPRVRYDATTNKYEILMPSRGWEAVTDDPNGAVTTPNQDWITAGGTKIHNYTAPDVPGAANQYSYTSLLSYTDAAYAGDFAFGVATAQAKVPVTGTATYAGLIAGRTTEVANVPGKGTINPTIDGTISMAFNFGTGSLAGSIAPSITTATKVALPTMNFVNTVYATGSATFSGQFVTALPGDNGFNGKFTGPAAEELMGSFRFPYVSPNDGNTYGAVGAFVGKK